MSYQDSDGELRCKFICHPRYLQAPTYIALISLLTYRGCRLGRTYVELAPELTILVLMAQWLKRLTCHQKVAEIVILKLEFHER